MALVKQKAIVLRTMKYSETSKIVVLLSENHGLIKLMAKGVRKSKSRISGILEPLNTVEVVFYDKANQELHTLNQASIVHAPIKLQLEAEDVMLALACCEMLTRVQMHADESKSIFDLLAAFISKFEKQDARGRRLYFLIFQLQLIKELGLGPELSQCALCGKTESEHWKVQFKEGSLLCDSCLEKGSDNSWISNSVRATIRYFMYSPFTALGEVSHYLVLQTKIYAFIHTYFQFHLEELLNLKSMAVLQKMKKFQQEILHGTATAGNGDS